MAIVKFKKIHIIVNPAAGKLEPILPIFNSVMTKAGIDWEMSVTKEAGDGIRLTKEALKAKVDVIGVYGGDGSVMEVVSAMQGSGVPLAIFPGGTANVLATELNIPKNLTDACEMVCTGGELKTVDLGQFDRRYFILRAGLGFEADMVKGADRKIKNKMGLVAYVLAAIAAYKKLQEARYTINVDGTGHKVKGFTCIVANSGNLGFKDLSLDKHIDVSDGLLDVVVVKKANISLFGHIVATILRHERADNVELVEHFQGKEIHVTSVPKQRVQCDGEVMDKIPINAKIIPGAVQILVPKQTEH